MMFVPLVLTTHNHTTTGRYNWTSRTNIHHPYQEIASGLSVGNFGVVDSDSRLTRRTPQFNALACFDIASGDVRTIRGKSNVWTGNPTQNP